MQPCAVQLWPLWHGPMQNPPQPFGVPQTGSAPHDGVQPQTFACLPPPQVSGAWHPVPIQHGWPAIPQSLLQLRAARSQNWPAAQSCSCLQPALQTSAARSQYDPAGQGQCAGKLSHRPAAQSWFGPHPPAQSPASSGCIVARSSAVESARSAPSWLEARWKPQPTAVHRPSSETAQARCRRGFADAVADSRAVDKSTALESIRGGLSRPPSSSRARRASPHRASIARLTDTSSLERLRGLANSLACTR